ncbi:MAG: single-stranded DNA-binding protein [Ghiorsea sp.]
MSAKNNCTFIGNLGRDVEVRATQGGTSVAKFSVPITSGFGDKEKTTWVNCVMFGKRCEGGLMQYLKKGTQVSVTGEISLNTYQNKEGIEKSSLEMKIDDVALIGKKPDNQQQGQQNYQQPQSNVQQAGDSIPF